VYGAFWLDGHMCNESFGVAACIDGWGDDSNNLNSIMEEGLSSCCVISAFDVGCVESIRSVGFVGFVGFVQVYVVQDVVADFLCEVNQLLLEKHEFCLEFILNDLLAAFGKVVVISAVETAFELFCL